MSYIQGAHKKRKQIYDVSLPPPPILSFDHINVIISFPKAEMWKLREVSLISMGPPNPHLSKQFQLISTFKMCQVEKIFLYCQMEGGTAGIVPQLLISFSSLQSKVWRGTARLKGVLLG